jgi:nucleotide-binding universal stress UspA family protein
MSYRTILVHVDNTDAAPARIKLAADLARREGAHLIGAALTGVPRYMCSGSPFEISGQFVSDYLRTAEQQADAALVRFDELCERAEITSREQRRADEDEYTGLCLHARYADLVVLGQAVRGSEENGGPTSDLPQQVVLHCGRPVLMVPAKGEFRSIGSRPVIAWNGSVEAARAVTAALPLLREAGYVTVLMFANQGGSRSSDPGADIALYLARHGLNVEVKVCPPASDAGHAILSEAAKLQADLLVMGAYGHSRFREMILGGATRTVLSELPLPVLMAH